ALQYVLDAGPGFVSYLWHDGSTGQTYTIKTPGINNCGVTVTDLNGCTGYDEIKIMLAVPDIGVVEIMNPKTSCSLGTDENVRIAIQNLSNWDIDKSEIIAVAYSLNGCTGYDEIKIMLAVPDIGVVEIVNPKTSCSLGTDENVRIAIQNLSNWDIDKSASISVAYSLNGRPAVTENVVLNATFENGAVIYHAFVHSEDLSTPDNYVITAATVYESDLIPSNDTMKINFSVYGSPVVDIGNGRDTILTYNPVVLSATQGYASYKWQDGSTGSDFGINTPGAGMYSVLVTGSNGCSTRDSVYVAYDVPDIGINRIVAPVTSCNTGQNNPVSFEVVNNGFYRITGNETITASYKVNNGVPITETIKLAATLYPGQSGIVSFTTWYDFSEAGNYQINITLEYTPDQNPINNTLSNTISVWNFPEIEIGGGKDTIKTYTLPITLDAGTGFVSYQWQDNSAGSTFNVTQWNLYWVRVTDEHGCSSADSVYVYSPFNINDLQIFPGKVNIYPNPVQDILHVAVDMDVVKNIRMELFDLKSILAYRKDLKQIQSADNDIYVNGFAPGEYFLRISVDKVSHTYKVIVK
ncbi:MAG: hypothetical protein H6Q23_705, partial [Bacteroidetes bacterium]|nr:hypothetical protein [Bacteroidota bacterium]